jgi:hypothetical protein
LRQVVDFESVTLEIPEEVLRAQSIGTRYIILESLLWGSWYRMCLLPDVGVDLTGVSRWLACTWGGNNELLLSPGGSGSICVFTLLLLLVCFSILRRHIRRDD